MLKFIDELPDNEDRREIGGAEGKRIKSPLKRV
jgi:hypothetical protein